MEKIKKSNLEVFREKIRKIKEDKASANNIKLPDTKRMLEKFKARVAKHGAEHPVTKEQMAQIIERIKNNKKEE